MRQLLYNIFLSTGNIDSLWKILERIAYILTIQIVDLAIVNIKCLVTKVNLSDTVRCVITTK